MSNGHFPRSLADFAKLVELFWVNEEEAERVRVIFRHYLELIASATRSRPPSARACGSAGAPTRWRATLPSVSIAKWHPRLVHMSSASTPLPTSPIAVMLIGRSDLAKGPHRAGMIERFNPPRQIREKCDDQHIVVSAAATFSTQRLAAWGGARAKGDVMKSRWWNIFDGMVEIVFKPTVSRSPSVTSVKTSKNKLALGEEIGIMRVGLIGLVGIAAALSSIAPAAAAVRIEHDVGGQIEPYLESLIALRSSGERVIIDGPCLSACTMVLGVIPRERICMTRRARLGFHAAWHPGENGQQVMSHGGTQFLMKVYPQTVRSWIASKGGLRARMLYLHGRELAQMYPTC